MESKDLMRKALLLFLLLCFACACTRVPQGIEPLVQTPPHPKEVQREKRTRLCLPDDFSISPFEPLTPLDCATDWGKEYRIALSFAEDFDLYRAITGFKRALCLIPPEENIRRLELHYCVALSYFLGRKYIEALYSVESTELIYVNESFPAFGDLLVLLHECYGQLGKEEHAAHILNLIETRDGSIAQKLSLLKAVRRADFAALCQFKELDAHYIYLDKMLARYELEAKSVTKAQVLNALLPGSGYWYVGLKQTAITAFTVNALFIAAATYFFCNNNPAAGAITLSLESGWYFGGITGAGFAAKAYNEQLYCTWADKIAQKESYFPLMMIKYTF